ncbi:hypothetical protein C8R43DRAFT_1139478 [Mycena crocata]|nr:hypothetical protein C8R43DRAFT_1139478 [Mycena crocata]
MHGRKGEEGENGTGAEAEKRLGVRQKSADIYQEVTSTALAIPQTLANLYHLLDAPMLVNVGSDLMTQMKRADVASWCNELGARPSRSWYAHLNGIKSAVAY